MNTRNVHFYGQTLSQNYLQILLINTWRLAFWVKISADEILK